MSKQLLLKFNPDQEFQLEAIQSVIDVLSGLPRHTSEFALGDDIVANLPTFQNLNESWLRDNVVAVQERNGVEPINDLAADDGLVLEGTGSESWRYPSFTIEMETGTGKTYVYLRTVYELRKKYGFRKFIIVVPSIAIYEGVIKNFQVTRSHLSALYGNEPTNLIRFDSDRLSALRNFATSTFVEIMVITLDSFNKISNRIFRPSEQLPGERLPYHYVQEVRPIVILDEPQNMRSDTSKAALRTLHPLFALRYSATHNEIYNLLYRLTPFEAYRRGLVKRIQVDGVTEKQSFNEAFLALREINIGRGLPTAVVRTLVMDGGVSRERDVELRQGDDLYAKTKRDEHRGMKVQEIDKTTGIIDLGSIQLSTHDVFGGSKEAIFRTQIEETVVRHMRTQEALHAQGVKVLSLFFIDRVANYVDENGIIKRLFDEAFERHKHSFPLFADLQPDEVRDAYFAKRKSKNAEEAIDTDSRSTAERKAEKAAFELIMREKERLLSLDEPKSFIFAHSALKEGWDNPNVFQICTLNQTVSEMRKRQEIGRGLRLPVNQDGERIFDENVNVLTVIANESYDRYASMLQTEYQEVGQAAPPPPTKADKAIAVRNDDVYNNALFRQFWGRLSNLTRYQINVDTQALIEECVSALNSVNVDQLKPQIVVQLGEFVITRLTLTLEEVKGINARIRLEITSTEPQTRLFGDTTNRTYTKREDLAARNDEPRLRGFRIREIVDAENDSHVVFENDKVLYLNTSIMVESEAGQVAQQIAVYAPEAAYPVFNLIDRAAKETGLTRPTINKIFRRLDDHLKSFIFNNPEGFANLFISTLKDMLADHIVERIEFLIGGVAEYDLEELFPPQKLFVQKELIEAGPYGLYDKVQVDSEVEKRFVGKNLTGRDDRVISYFKFPPAFKISFPKVLGNYNPDWGILRYNDEDNVVLQLVRETKGGEDPSRLQFSHEKRKIMAAAKRFHAVGVDYRIVTDNTIEWWKPDGDDPNLKLW